MIGRRGEVGAALDRDAVVVKHPDQLAELLMAGKGRGLMADAFHQIAVRAENDGVMVDDLVPGAVESGGKPPLCEGHADGVRDAGTERSGRGFDAGSMPDLRVPRGLGAELPEILDIVEADVVAAQVQHRIQQHRGMSDREHEAITIGPVGRCRVVLQVLREEHVSCGSQRHRRTRVPEFARCTASIESTRTASMQSRSCGFTAELRFSRPRS